MSRVLSI